MKFTKMQGLGNDYIYINCTKGKNIENIEELAVKLSDRHFGIGSDGIILICDSKVADFKMEIYNKDGTEAEMCGNGIRCVGKFVYDKGLIHKENITIETLAGIKKLKLEIKNEKVEFAEVDMGIPILEAEKVPVLCEEKIAQNIKIRIEDKEFKATCVSMGNPHTVIIVEKVEEFPVEKYGKIIEKNNIFPNRTNVEFIEIINSNKIKMRVWERGVGETLACGTGACSAVVACILNNKTNKKVEVELLGGNLEIEWKENKRLYMKGPAIIVFEGEIE